MARGTVYRAFDSQKRLLYVGTTVTPNRLRDHASVAPWWSLTVRIELTHFDTAPEAEAAEADAIYTEQPLFNRANNRVWGSALARNRGEAPRRSRMAVDRQRPRYVDSSIDGAGEASSARREITRLVGGGLPHTVGER